MKSNGNNSNGWNELELLEKKMRQKIGAFALHDHERMMQATRWLELAKSINKRYEMILQEVYERLNEGRKLLDSRIEIQQSVDAADRDKQLLPEIPTTHGGKARGRQCRAAYVARQAKEKTQLVRVRGALYRNTAGLVVGIAYAKERKNEWFLGLPAGQFQEAVLLCETNNDLIQTIYLTEGFIRKYERHLSVSHQYSQAKFNVQRRIGKFYLLVKDCEDVDLTDYIASEPLVCPPTGHANN